MKHYGFLELTMHQLQQKIKSVVYSRGHDAYDDETDECRLLVDLFHLFLICVAKLGIVGE